jgi:hypothetical protein
MSGWRARKAAAPTSRSSSPRSTARGLPPPE